MGLSSHYCFYTRLTPNQIRLPDCWDAGETIRLIAPTESSLVKERLFIVDYKNPFLLFHFFYGAGVLRSDNLVMQTISIALQFVWEALAWKVFIVGLTEVCVVFDLHILHSYRTQQE